MADVSNETSANAIFYHIRGQISKWGCNSGVCHYSAQHDGGSGMSLRAS